MGIILQDDQAKELVELTRQNNRMLKDMRRDAMIGGIIHFVWWVILVVVLPYLTWLYIQPYLDGVLSAYQNMQGQSAQVTNALNQLQQAGGNADLQKLIDQAKGFLGQ